MLSFESLCEDREAHAHLVQFCDAEEPVLANVSGYLSAGLKQGDALLVIASAKRNSSLARALQESGADLYTEFRERRVLFADAEQTLSRFMIDGQPEWGRFQRTVGALIENLQAKSDRTLRAYGEMVGILWKQREFTAAIRLEHYWNKILSSNSFHLFCSYPIDLFGKDFHPGAIDALLAAHTHLVPAHAQRGIETAIDRAMSEVLGSKAEQHRVLIRSNSRLAWPILPEAEAVILWLRSNLPSHAEEILALARQYLQPSHRTEFSSNTSSH
jgi:DcmR-like sensory protein